MIKENFDNNGYDYVDLGLPSGTLWATMNVGANNPLNCGLYFQWGDTKGYSKDQIGKDKQFNWRNYKWYSGGTFTKYTAPGATLELEDDAAHVNMGGDWHMPSPEQIQELIDNTTREFELLNADVGYVTFTSKKDTSKSIFFPTAGNAWDGSVQNSGGGGDVWSSVLDTGDVISGQSLFFDSGYVSLYGSYRYYGLSVRGVIDTNNGKRNKIMNENLDLTKILKDAPKGTKLWSPICGECELKGITKDVAYPITCLTKDHKGEWETLVFTSKGEYCVDYDNTECVLFPSKENRDWAAFKVPKKHKEFKPFEKVLVEVITKTFPQIISVWFPDIYLFYDEENSCHRVAINNYIYNDDSIIPFEGNEDKAGKNVE